MTVPTNATCSSYYTVCGSTTSKCKSWNCNSGYKKNTIGTACVKTCTPYISKISACNIGGVIDSYGFCMSANDYKNTTFCETKPGLVGMLYGFQYSWVDTENETRVLGKIVSFDETSSAYNTISSGQHCPAVAPNSLTSDGKGVQYYLKNSGFGGGNYAWQGMWNIYNTSWETFKYTLKDKAQSYSPSAAGFESEDFGEGNWWIPSLGELAMIYGLDQTKVTSDTGTSGATNTTISKLNNTRSIVGGKTLSGIYWSSTAETSDCGTAWAVNLNNGQRTLGSSSSSHYIRYVTDVEGPMIGWIFNSDGTISEYARSSSYPLGVIYGRASLCFSIVGLDEFSGDWGSQGLDVRGYKCYQDNGYDSEIDGNVCSKSFREYYTYDGAIMDTYNYEGYGHGIFGTGKWHLPSIYELKQIADPRVISTMDDLSEYEDAVTLGGEYWSSNALSGSRAYVFDMDSSGGGTVTTDARNVTHYIRPVLRLCWWNY